MSGTNTTDRPPLDQAVAGADPLGVKEATIEARWSFRMIGK